jgi:hypothetical protein
MNRKYTFRLLEANISLERPAGFAGALISMHYDMPDQSMDRGRENTLGKLPGYFI